MRKIIIYLTLVLPIFSFAQKEDFIWISGYESWAGPPWGGNYMAFDYDTVYINWFNIPIDFDVTNSSICDTSGNLLFYTNGWMIANNNLDTLMYGDSLSPCQYSYDFGPFGITLIQGALTLPLPSDTNIYYLFHETYLYDGYADHILYSTIDMRLDSGKGAVVNKNIDLINDSMMGGMITAVRHANGRDWWVTIPQYGGDSIYIFMLSPAGITDLHTQKIDDYDSHFYTGQAVFSPDGSTYARIDYTTKSRAEVFDFDRCTGIFSNKRVINYNELNWGGVGISPNSKVLYVTANDTVFQYDLTAGNIAASQIVVAVYDSFASPFGSTYELAQIAPDGKLYIACGNGENVMHVIDYPDSLGLACHFCQHCISIPAYNAFGIPNYPNFRLGALVGSPCDTLGIGIAETPDIISGKIFPNPAKDWIVFELAQTLKENATLSIYNILGEQVLKQSLNAGQMRYSININDVADGMYIVKVSSAKGGLYNGKLIIQK